MSPLALRRFRAERLLRRDFAGLRTKVLSAVSSRLDAAGGALDMADLEACYAQAWHGLYAAVLDGQEIANPAGWLVVVTLRRAIDERRARHDVACAAGAEVEDRGRDPDMAARIDDIRTLRHVFEGLRERLSARECEAAALCYVQGLSRAEAAQRMGVSMRRMSKLMDGDGAGRRGVTTKIGELLAVIRAEGWCQQHDSMMRALAFGVLDPEGERYRLAIAHQRACPACRRYVLSLRELAAILPPLALPGAIIGGAGAGVGAGAGGASIGIGGGVASGSAAGGGAGWPLAVPLGAKLAGGLAALGVAAGGAAIVAGVRHPSGHHPARSLMGGSPAARRGNGYQAAGGGVALTSASQARARPSGSLDDAGRPVSGTPSRSRVVAVHHVEGASAEFGIEQTPPAASGATASAQPRPRTPVVTTRPPEAQPATQTAPTRAGGSAESGTEGHAGAEPGGRREFSFE
jgi:DNA-directed RNA polymerase specialized sigma24 family protein